MTEAVSLRTKHWTYRDYYALNDDKRYEVIEGELIMTPAPSFKHQEIVSRLFRILSNHVYEKGMGKIVVSPLDVVLNDDIALQPDIVYISNKNTGIIKEAGIFGPPDIVIEILSPTSIYKDIHVKKRIYEKAGIKEYWLVFPDEKVIEIFSIEKGRYELAASTEKTGKIKSNLLAIEINIKDAL